MSIRMLQMAWQSSVPYIAKLALLALADAADSTGASWPKISTLVQKTGMPKSTLMRQLSVLEEAGIIVRHRGVNRVTYRINLPQACPGAGPEESRSGTPHEGGSPAESSPDAVPERDRSGPGVGPRKTTSKVPERDQACPGAGLPKKRSQKEPKDKSKSRGSLEEFRQYASSLGLPSTDGEFLHAHFEENGWKRGKETIRDWRASMRKWKVGGWLPSLKQVSPQRSQSVMNLLSNQ